ncbi:MAG: class IV adenylate cyclase [Acidobacteria bacterium]|nr:class IV adenylate cyclase [Acidobacteriota bacterium]
MSIETEIKVEIGEPEAFCRTLDALGATPVSARHFEDNRLFDFPDGRLVAQRCTLRVRIAGGRATLTFKGAPRAGGVFRVREELETGLGDGATALEILGRLGIRPVFRYQKYRREFALDGVLVAVDETPIGNYTELEGSKEAIRALAHALSFSEDRFIRASYHALYLEFCRREGTAPGGMVF